MCHHYESTPEWEVLVRQALERKGTPEEIENAERDEDSDAETNEEPFVTPADD